MIIKSTRNASTKLVHNLTGGPFPPEHVIGWTVTDDDKDMCRLANGYTFTLDRVSVTWRSEWTIRNRFGEVVKTGKSKTVFGVANNIARASLMI